MTATGRLIEYILETTSWNHRYDYGKVALEIEQRLLANAIVEITKKMEGTTAIDTEGQLVVYTNVYPEGVRESTAYGDGVYGHVTDEVK
jgi:hypothetical protein